MNQLVLRKSLTLKSPEKIPVRSLSMNYNSQRDFQLERNGVSSFAFDGFPIVGWY